MLLCIDPLLFFVDVLLFCLGLFCLYSRDDGEPNERRMKGGGEKQIGEGKK